MVVLAGEQRRAVDLTGAHPAPGGGATRVLLLTDHPGGAAAVVPSVTALRCSVTVRPLGWDGGEDAEVLLIDGTGPVAATVAGCRSAAVRAPHLPRVLVVDAAVLAIVKGSWDFDGWVMAGAGPGELRARLRLAVQEVAATTSERFVAGGLELDLAACTATLHGAALNLTYTEFQLLGALMSRPGLVWSRPDLLRDVWGYADAPPDTRTVDVHIRRLRAKLGPEAAACITTVRNVGYRLSDARAPTR